MKIKTFQGGFDKNLSYLIWCGSTRKAGIVDASVELTEIFECIEAKNLILEKIFITHTHFDHINYLEDIKYQFPQIQVCGFNNPEEALGENYRKLNHHEIIPLGSEMFTALHTPGHYPDSMCFWNKKEIVFLPEIPCLWAEPEELSEQKVIFHIYIPVYIMNY